MDYIIINNRCIIDFLGPNEFNNLYLTQDTFQFKYPKELDRIEKIVIDAINLLLLNKNFIKMNELITAQYSFYDYLVELRNFIIKLYSKEPGLFSLVLESTMMNGIYLRAYFTANEIDVAMQQRFRGNIDNRLTIRPDYTDDIKVIRRASMELLYKKLTSESSKFNFKDVDLNTVNIWDYPFGLA